MAQYNISIGNARAVHSSILYAQTSCTVTLSLLPLPKITGSKAGQDTVSLGGGCVRLVGSVHVMDAGMWTDWHGSRSVGESAW
jgi:hypothetical protein